MPDVGPGSSRDDRFATTRWSLVEVARGGDSPEARRAMAVLCETYWYPIYAYVRRSGQSPDEAQDLTQEVFVRVFRSLSSSRWRAGSPASR